LQIVADSHADKIEGAGAAGACGRNQSRPLHASLCRRGLTYRAGHFIRIATTIVRKRTAPEGSRCGSEPRAKGEETAPWLMAPPRPILFRSS
jgi:hypothetical protein